MTFGIFESSTETSQPIELYLFQVGLGAPLAFTSSEDEQVVDGVTYVPEAIKRGRLSQGHDKRDSVLEISVPKSNLMAKQYLAVVPAQEPRVTIKRIQRADGPTPEVVTLFVGMIRSVNFGGQGKLATISVAPLIVASSRAIPRYTYQSLCNHVLYDGLCKILATDPLYLRTGIASRSSGVSLTVAGLSADPDGFFKAGFVQVNGDARMILDHVGDVLTLMLPFPFNVAGQTVEVLAGCDHSPNTCKTKFNNIINYGGFAFVPKRDIFKHGIL